MHPVFRPRAVACITGSASGIGLSLAHLCASRSMRLALIDISSEKLSSAKSAIEKAHSNAEVLTFPFDVSDSKEWNKCAEEVKKSFGTVDLLALNAGRSVKEGMGFDKPDTEAYFRKTLDTNFFGIVNGVSTFLPLLRTGKEPSAIVITGSKQGITNPPGNPAYNASKAAVKSYAEGLAHELHVSHTNVSVHLLVPGWTFTGITGDDGQKKKPDGAWAPEQVVSFLDGKMSKGEFYVICPDDDTTEEDDKRRMLWGTGDIVHARPPLSRWNEEWKEKAKKGVSEIKLD